MISENYRYVIMERFACVIHVATESLFVTHDRMNHLAEFGLVRSLYFTLKCLNLINLTSISETSLLKMFSNIFVDILQLSTCRPASYSNLIGLSQKEGEEIYREKMNILFNGISSTAIMLRISISDEFSKKPTDELLNTWGSEWRDIFCNLKHCSGPSDILLYLDAILAVNPSYGVWRIFSFSRDFWNSSARPFVQSPTNPSIFLDKIFSWVSIMPTQAYQNYEMVKYDHDGLSLYAKLAIFATNLSTFHPPPNDFSWIAIQLTKFLVIVTLASKMPLVTLSSVVNLKKFSHEALLAISEIFTDQLVEQGIYLCGMEITMESLVNAKTLMLLIDRVEKFEIRDLLVNSMPGPLQSALLLSCEKSKIPISEELILSAISEFMNIESLNSGCFSILTTLDHMINSAGENLVNIPQLLRKIRRWYDTDDSVEVAEDFVNAQCISIVSGLCLRISTSGEDVGVGMMRFLRKFSLTWLNFPQSPLCFFRALLLIQQMDFIELYESQDNARELLVYQAYIQTDFGNNEIEDLLAELVASINIESIAHIVDITILSKKISGRIDTAKQAYRIIQYLLILQVRADSLAIELDSEKKIVIGIGLIGEISNIPNVSNLQGLFSFAIRWMIILDHYVDATFELKSQYTQQLRTLDIIDGLMNIIFRVLNVGIGDWFCLHQWDVQEFHIEGFEPEPQSFSLIYAHLYWRLIKTLPSLVRIWFVECKNRKLSAAVSL